MGPRTRRNPGALHGAQASPLQLPWPRGTHGCPRDWLPNRTRLKLQHHRVLELGQAAQPPHGQPSHPRKAGTAPRPAWAAGGQLGTAPLTGTLTAALCPHSSCPSSQHSHALALHAMAGHTHNPEQVALLTKGKTTQNRSVCSRFPAPIPLTLRYAPALSVTQNPAKERVKDVQRKQEPRDMLLCASSSCSTRQQHRLHALLRSGSEAGHGWAGGCIVSRDMHWGQHGHASCPNRKMVGHAQVSASESKTPAATADEGTCSGRSAIKLLALYPKHLVFINPYLISLKGLTIYTPKVRHKLQRSAGTKLSIKCD